MSISCNNGFWDLPAEDRAARIEAACDRFDTPNFFDLDPEQRSYAYEGPRGEHDPLDY